MMSTCQPCLTCSPTTQDSSTWTYPAGKCSTETSNVAVQPHWSSGLGEGEEEEEEEGRGRRRRGGRGGGGGGERGEEEDGEGEGGGGGGRRIVYMVRAGLVVAAGFLACMCVHLIYSCVQFNEATLRTHLDGQLKDNRKEWGESVEVLSSSLSLDLVQRLVRLEHSVAELARLNQHNKGTRPPVPCERLDHLHVNSFRVW